MLSATMWLAQLDNAGTGTLKPIISLVLTMGDVKHSFLTMKPTKAIKGRKQKKKTFIQLWLGHRLLRYLIDLVGLYKQ